ncbi:hypothetical protein KR009_002648 [Drosophila setifemur]|nr:hypothetical protein KR009_002648 [Drosophila setifemur]
MAEVHIIGKILKVVDFSEPHLYIKWGLQSGKFDGIVSLPLAANRFFSEGNAWRQVQGEVQGQSPVSSHRLQSFSDFALPLDIHLSAAAVQGWPRLLVEVFAVNVLQKSWPIGYGFAHIPSTPGAHRLEINTWKVAPDGWWQHVRERFGGGGSALSKSDLLYSGEERYKLQTLSSGKVIVDLNLILRMFEVYGVELK